MRESGELSKEIMERSTVERALKTETDATSGSKSSEQAQLVYVKRHKPQHPHHVMVSSWGRNSAKKFTLFSKRGQQPLHFLRKLVSSNVDQTILTLFYRCFVRNVPTFSLICWWDNLSLSDKSKLEKLVKICSKITDQQILS